MKKIFLTVCLLSIFILTACDNKSKLEAAQEYCDNNGGTLTQEDNLFVCTYSDGSYCAASDFRTAGCITTEKTANPAAQYCIDQGGEYEIITSETAIYGQCSFGDGKICEEWEFYETGICGDYVDEQNENLIGESMSVDNEDLEEVLNDSEDEFITDTTIDAIE